MIDLKSSEEVRARSLVALEEAIKIVGNTNKLAKVLGISSPIIKQWKTSGKYGVNAKYVIPIENLTEEQVKRYELRCDLYPERDNYFVLLKKIAYDICHDYGFTKIDEMRQNLMGVVNKLEKITTSHLSNPDNRDEVIKFTHNQYEFKKHLLESGYYETTRSNPSTNYSQAYFAFQADVCIALYNQLHVI